MGIIKVESARSIKDYQSLVKHNHLIKGKYSLEASEQKLLYKLFEHVQKNNYTTKELTLSFSNFYKEFKSILGKNITKEDFKNIIEGLQDKKPYIIIGDEFIRTQWYKIRGKLDYETVKLILDDDVFRYIQVQEKNFTMLRLESVYSFKRFYTMRIYELIKQWSNTKKVIILPVDELKQHLDIENNPGYKNYSGLRRYVLDPAIKEINEKSELTVSYEPVKSGRKVVAIEFTVLEQLPAFKYPENLSSPRIDTKSEEDDHNSRTNDFYIPNPEFLEEAVRSIFPANFAEYDFSDEDYRQAYIESVMVTFHRDKVSVISPEQYGFFYKTLLNKIKDIEFKRGLEDSDKMFDEDWNKY